MDDLTNAFQGLDGEPRSGERGIPETDRWKASVSEIKKGPEILEDPYRAALESISDALFTVDGDLRIVAVDKAPGLRLGHQGKGIRGLEVAEALPFLSQSILDQYREIFRTGKAVIAEETIKLDEKDYFIEIRHTPVREMGRVTKVLTALRDITDARPTQSAVMSEKNGLQRMIDSMPFGITLQDREYNVLFHNELMRNWLGESVGTKCYRSYQARDRVCPECPVELSFKDDLSHKKERVITTRSGETLILENTTIPLKDDSGNITSCMEIVADITERKRAEEYLQESRDQTRELFRTSAVPQIIMDPGTGVFIQCNESAIKTFGYENRKQMLGKTPTDVSTPIQYDGSESAPMVAKHIGACWREGVHVFEWRYQRPNGQIWDADVQIMLFLYHGKPYMQFTLRDMTEHRQTLDALAKAEEKYRAIFDNASIGIYGWSTRKRIVVANPTLARIFGFDSPRELMDSITDVATQVYVDPLDFTRIGELCSEQGFVNGYETQLCRKDKTLIWVSITMSAIKDGEGNVVYFEGTVQDISDRKQAEEALKRSEGLLKSIFHASPAGISFLVDRKAQKVNATLARITGYSEEEHLGQSTRRFYTSEEEYDRVGQAYKEMERDGLGMAEARFRRKDGNIIDVLICLSPINPHDSKAGVVATILDTTRLKQAEMALKQSEEQYRTLVGNMYDAVYRSDVDGNVIFTTPSAARILGYSSAEEIIGLNIARDLYYYPERREDLLRILREEGKVTNYEVILKRRDNRPIIISTNSQLYRDKEGNIIGVEGVYTDITDRKQAEEALRWKTALLEAQLNASLDGILVVDETNRRIITNRRLIDLWKIPQHILDDEDDTALLTYVVSLTKRPEEFLQKVMYLYDHPYETGRDEIEFRNGMVLDRYSAPVQDEKGHLYGRIWTFRDITERKKAEEELRESEERFRTLIEGAPEAIFLQTGGRFIYVNPAMVRLLGALTPEDLLEKVQFTWMAPEYHEATRARMKLQLETGKPVPPAERVYLRFDGSRVPVESTAVPVRINGVDAHLVFLRDITERKKAEEQLRQSEEMYRTLIAASPDAITVTDLSGRITLASRKALELCSVPPEQNALGRSILEWVPPDGQIEANAALQQLLATGISTPRELVLKRDDGSLFSAEIHGAPLRSADSIVRGAILIARDVTERNNLQAQLLQSQKMEAIGTLAGGVAHDFNNILTAIMGYAHLVQATMPEGHPVRAYAQEINNCTSKAANVTRSLLAFSRKQTIQLQPNSVNMILSDLEKLLKRLVPEDVTFTMSLHEDMIIMADMTQIDQVLINLASNAKDAMPRGGALHIETKMVEIGKEFRQAHGFGEPGRYAMISVADTGSGIDEAIQKKIFEPFFTTKEVGKGTGLGLSIVYGIIKQHNGYITVSSEPGKGTAFEIYLPTLKIESSQQKQAPIPAPGGTENILLAEDDAHVRRTVRDILHVSGYTIIEAADGEDAVKQYREHHGKIDLVILDVVMPGRNGKEAFEEIRKINPSIPALFMSGYTGDMVLDKGVPDIAVNYIPKPLVADELLKKIREMLER